MNQHLKLAAIALFLGLSAAGAQTITPGSSGGGSPTGAAGGVLSGTYPNPGLNAACSALSNDGPYCSATQGQLPGTTTNDSATAGNIGEYISSTVASGSAVALTTTIQANMTSISLTAGDWDVSATFNLVSVGTPTLVWLLGSISQTSATLDSTPGNQVNNLYSGAGTAVPVSGAYPMLLVGPVRKSLSGTTTIYAVIDASFTGGTSLSSYGIISARRVR